MRTWKYVQELVPEDFYEYPVWGYVENEPDVPDTAVAAIDTLPIYDLRGKLIGTKIKLHNGSTHWVILSNISLHNPRVTKHFIAVSIERNGKWFNLARYHDADYSQRGPEQLAHFLELSISDIFPMQYDVRGLVVGNPIILRGMIPIIPEECLTQAELIELAMDS